MDGVMNLLPSGSSGGVTSQRMDQTKIQAFAAKHAWNPNLRDDVRGLARSDGLDLDDEWVARLSRLTPSELEQLATNWDAFFAAHERLIARGTFTFADVSAAQSARSVFGRGLVGDNFKPEDWALSGSQLTINTTRDVEQSTPDDHAAFQALQALAESGAVEVTRAGVVTRFAIDASYRKLRDLARENLARKASARPRTRSTKTRSTTKRRR
jgi:hypothetical protein